MQLEETNRMYFADRFLYGMFEAIRVKPFIVVLKIATT